VRLPVFPNRSRHPNPRAVKVALNHAAVLTLPLLAGLPPLLLPFHDTPLRSVDRDLPLRFILQLPLPGSQVQNKLLVPIIVVLPLLLLAPPATTMLNLILLNCTFLLSPPILISTFITPLLATSSLLGMRCPLIIVPPQAFLLLLQAIYHSLLVFTECLLISCSTRTIAPGKN